MTNRAKPLFKKSISIIESEDQVFKKNKKTIRFVKRVVKCNDIFMIKTFEQLGLVNYRLVDLPDQKIAIQTNSDFTLI